MGRGRVGGLVETVDDQTVFREKLRMMAAPDATLSYRRLIVSGFR